MTKLHQGDCLEVMADMADASVDSIVTDPPYHLTSIVKRFGKEGSAPAQFGTDGAYQRASRGFMGKEWDGGDIAFRSETWAECLRVLKPGGHLLAFSGTRTQHRMVCAIEDAGFEIRDMIAWVYGTGFPKSHNLDDDWQGWGTALKPALEPIMLARKPLIGTVAANVMEHGTGALNIDGCRVEADGETPAADRRAAARKSGKAPMSERVLGSAIAAETQAMGKIGRRGSADVYMEERQSEQLGRWPANLIHDGGEEVVRLLTDSARFFYCAKASKKDRGEGNLHPTVKPADLMRYLCRLITPPGGIILDPFMGSGSTGKAAVLEGFEFVGIEISGEYIDTARRRITEASDEMASDLF